MPLTNAESGPVPIVQATGMPAADHGRQVGLARGDREFREVRDPQCVRPFGVEIPVHQVLRGFGELALVRAVPFRACEQRYQAVPGHEPHDPFGAGHGLATACWTIP